ncbi:hypothetical protein D5086_025983 [Populus alba]|uniref:Uncharacterized protein n=1 Tax=Populus alba TaxID=43335 RepID=A0ACC4B1H5_POPAL
MHTLRKPGKLHAGKLYTSLTSVVPKQNPSCIFQLLPFVGETVGGKGVTMRSLAWQPITRFDRCIAGKGSGSSALDFDAGMAELPNPGKQQKHRIPKIFFGIEI